MTHSPNLWRGLLYLWISLILNTSGAVFVAIHPRAEMGVYTQLPAGLNEVDVIIVGGKFNHW
jgi:hypothetical protein